MAGRRQTEGDKSLRRQFVTPEGVDLKLDLAGAGERACAFLIDVCIIVGVLLAMTIALLFGLPAAGEVASPSLTIIWLLGFFVLRNAWFTVFELSGRGATVGKRLLGLRVVARDGSRLTAGAVIVRNAMREIELFLPISFVTANQVSSRVDAFTYLLALAWVGVFLFFPLFNRDRLRVGDLLAGTWVVHTVKATLAPDLTAAERVRRVFPDAALNLYGVFELQTLENVLRRENDEAIATVAGSIRAKAGLADDGDDYGFLTDYYAALCARLERNAVLGRYRKDKSATAA
jgi:uncharacterized RDD family membrane protein YckC